MTLAEKAANIQSFNYALNREGLSLPATCWYTEAGHGARNARSSPGGTARTGGRPAPPPASSVPATRR